MALESPVATHVAVPAGNVAEARLARGTRPLSPRMRLPALRQFALSLPETTSVAQWGGLVFKVAGKVFFMIGLDGETEDGVIFKCTPEEFAALTEIDGIVQAPYFAKRHWVRVEDLAALPLPELQRRIRRSYDLVVAKLPKTARERLAPAG